MAKPPVRPVAPTAVAADLAARGAEALRLGRFKDAIEAFKGALRQEPQPDWRAALGQAYAGRARDLAAKGMFKEAAVVLENTRAADGTVAAPLLYLLCLIRQGQLPKAAKEIRIYLAPGAASAGRNGHLAELATALSLAVPGSATPPDDAWAARCRNAAQALQAWSAGEPAEAIERLLTGLPLRSAFRSLRLILKALVTGRTEPEKAAGLLAMVPAEGPFGRFASAAGLAIAPDAEAVLAGWGRLSRVQQAFVGEARGLPAAAADIIEQIRDAERRGPAALLAVLLRQPAGLPRADLRAACVELLVRVPEQLAAVERAFGALSDIERQRVLALAAEFKQDWARAEPHWRSLAEALDQQADPQARLAQAVVYRRLADLAADQAPRWNDADDDPHSTYLEHSLAADPEHLPTALRLIARYRDSGRSREWYRAVDRAVQTFPADSAVLAQAVETAMARKSYKKAAGFARRLLALDPINQAVRQRMIALQIAQARKQMQAARPDLAWKALAEAAEWQRADAPDASVRLVQGLVGLRLGHTAEAEATLREGVRLAGDGVAGWTHAALEASLMGVGQVVGALCDRELDRALRTPPGCDAILAVIDCLSHKEINISERVLTPLVARLENWLQAGASLDWSAAKFVAIADQLQRFRRFEVLHAYARRVATRTPQDGMPRFFLIVAQMQGDARRLTMDQEGDLQDLEEEAEERQDFQAARRIRQFLNGPVQALQPGRSGNRLDGKELEALFEAALDGIPDLLPRQQIRRMLNEIGRAATIDAIAGTLRELPFGLLLTPPQTRRLAEEAVARLLAPGGRR